MRIGRSLLLLCLTIVSAALILRSPAPAFAEPDDDVPGVPLPASSVVGTLTPSDTVDVYSFWADEGTEMVFCMRAADSWAWDEDGLRLFRPGTSSVYNEFGETTGMVDFTWTTYPKRLRHVARFTGLYLLAVKDNVEPGETTTYTVDYYKRRATPPTDSDIPGWEADLLTFGRSSESTDRADVSWFRLLRGQQLDLMMHGAAGRDFDLYLYDPTATSTKISPAVRKSTRDGTHRDAITWVARRTGRHYLKVRARSGSGDYMVQRQIRDATSLKITYAPRSVVYRGSARFSGTLKNVRTRGPVAGATITVLRSADGRTWFFERWPITASDGSFSFRTKPIGRDMLFRVCWYGDPGDQRYYKLAPSRAIRRVFVSR